MSMRTLSKCMYLVLKMAMMRLSRIMDDTKTKIAKKIKPRNSMLGVGANSCTREGWIEAREGVIEQADNHT